MILYKYCRADEEVIIKIFKERRIKFSCPLNFNDIYDMDPCYEFVDDKTSEAMKNEIVQLEINSRLNRFPEKNREELQLEIEEELNEEIVNGKWNNWSEYAIDQLRNEILSPVCVLSLSEINNCNLMWSHYAANHTGFVLGFDSKSRFFGKCDVRKGLRGLKKIKYVNKRPKLILPILDNDVENFDKLFYKYKVWEYEREWRSVRLLKSSKETVYSNLEEGHRFVEMPDDLIVSVAFGCRIEKCFSDMIQDIIDKDKIKLYRATRNASNYSIGIELV